MESVLCKEEWEESAVARVSLMDTRDKLSTLNVCFFAQNNHFVVARQRLKHAVRGCRISRLP